MTNTVRQETSDRRGESCWDVDCSASGAAPAGPGAALGPTLTVGATPRVSALATSVGGAATNYTEEALGNKIDEKHWSWIVPLVLLVMIAAGLFFGCIPQPAKAAEPSPSPVPDHVGATVSFNVIALLGFMLIVVGAIALVWRSLNKNTY